VTDKREAAEGARETTCLLGLEHEGQHVDDQQDLRERVDGARPLCQGNLRGTMSENGLYVVYALGSSNSMTFGCMQSARDGNSLLLSTGKLTGILVRLILDPYLAQSCHGPVAGRGLGQTWRTFTGASMQFSATDRCGNRLKL
jgi:hypothetical protein